MSLFLDVLTIAVLVFTVYRAFRRGLLRAVIELAGSIAAFLFAGWASAHVGAWLNRAFMNRYVHGTLKQAVSTYAGAGKEAFLQKLVSQLTGAFTETKAAHALASLHLNVADAGKEMVSTLSMPLAQALSDTLAFCAVLALCFVAVGILARFSDAVFHVPLIGPLNALAGAAAGLLEAMLLLFFISTLVSLSLSFLALGKNPPFTEKQVQATHVYKYVEQINPVTHFLSGK